MVIALLLTLSVVSFVASIAVVCIAPGFLDTRGGYQDSAPQRRSSILTPLCDRVS
jgi:hypothetical protein